MRAVARAGHSQSRELGFKSDTDMSYFGKFIYFMLF